MIKLSEIKSNPNNPRLIKDEKFKKLVNSIKEFPKMMDLRPIIIDNDSMILGGNMRLKALLELKYSEVPNEWIKKAKDLTEEEARRFVIADNVAFGEHDWDILANEWDSEELIEWGLDVWKAPVDVDYSILNDEDVSQQLSDMTNGVKKAIQIEFEAEHYEDAYALVKFWREQKAYVGGMIMEYLKAEKEKI